MKNIAIAAALAAITALPVQAQTPQQLAEQGLAAGAAYPGLADLCDLDKPLRTAGQRPPGGASRPRPETGTRPAPAAMPAKVFDNLYFLGHRAVSSWALNTSEGIILIDALNNDAEAKTHIEQGLLTLGLDPARIKYLIITHGHADHYGGHAYLVERYEPQVIMSGAEWQMLEKQPANPARKTQPPQRGRSVADGEQLTLGDTTLTFVVTPGHTPGTLSLIVPLRDGQRVHHAALWGGTGLNFGPDAARIRTYAASATRFRTIAQQAQVDIFLSNHPARDGSLERMVQLANRTAGAPHPYVNAQALGAFELISSCALAQAASLDAQ